MDIEREALIEVIVSSITVAAFVALVVWIGVTFPTLAGTGGLALVGAIVAFILGIGGVGYWLAGRGTS
jgi:hypothetical protein